MLGMQCTQNALSPLEQFRFSRDLTSQVKRNEWYCKAMHEKELYKSLPPKMVTACPQIDIHLKFESWAMPGYGQNPMKRWARLYAGQELRLDRFLLRLLHSSELVRFEESWSAVKTYYCWSSGLSHGKGSSLRVLRNEPAESFRRNSF